MTRHDLLQVEEGALYTAPRRIGSWGRVRGGSRAGDVRGCGEGIVKRERTPLDETRTARIREESRHRVVGGPATVAAGIRARIQEVMPGLPVPEIRSLEENLHQAVAHPRFDLQLPSSFAVIGLLMAIIGVYGLTAFEVRRRFREIGNPALPRCEARRHPNDDPP